jgi:RES domain-containing protein
VERTVFRLNHSRANRRRGCLLVAECGVEAHDRLLLLRGEHTVLQPRLQVVDPPQPAALAVPVQPCRRPDQTILRTNAHSFFFR